MIDWYTIEYLYPNAFKKFCDTMFPNVGIICTSSLGFYDVKKLYSFFDKQGIFLTIEMYNSHQWVFTISVSNGIVMGPQDSKKSREECEYNGFFDCFKILERVISTKVV